MILRSAKLFLLLMLVVLGGNAVAQTTMNSLDQNADQSQGQYMPMNMGYAGFNSLGMIQSAWLDPMQNLGEGQSKPAYSKYYWSPDLVLPIRLREGMMTLINFPNWELIEDIYIGDNATFDGQISGPNTLLLYPRKGANVGVDTNVIVFGRSGNKYVFYVKSEGVNTERLTNSIIDIDVIDGPSGSGGAGASSARCRRWAAGWVSMPAITIAAAAPECRLIRLLPSVSRWRTGLRIFRLIQANSVLTLRFMFPTPMTLSLRRNAFGATIFSLTLIWARRL